MKYAILLTTSLFLFLSSCQKEPILAGSQVTVTNSIQTAADPSAGGTGGAEMSIEDILGLPAGTFTWTHAVGEGVEFPGYLLDLYDIDLSEEAITFTLVADSNDLIHGPSFRIFEAGTFDRYYFNFEDKQRIKSFSSNNSSVTLETISDSEYVVVIGEGFDFNSGTSFTIALGR